jgi:hypothetical protein
MKLILYNKENKVVDVIENVVNPGVQENNVEWEGGSLSGINLPFLLHDDSVEVDEVTEEIIVLDKKKEHEKVDLAKENAELKAKQILMQEALDDLILGGGL